ncbi:MAG: YggT family protein [Coriobacteriaceae bacterium]|nr:YggT family protein [Coriobacteriaceae bacterium]
MIGFSSVYQVVSGLINFYGLLILVYVIMSWFRPSGPVFEVYRVLGSICEPYIGLFRRLLPATGGLDFSPMVALLVLQYIVRPVLLTLLASLGL